MKINKKPVDENFKIPFLNRDGQVLLLANDEVAAMALNDSMEEVVDILDAAGLELVYLPMILSGIMVDAMRYSSPSLAEMDLVGKISRAIMRGLSVDMQSTPFLLVCQDNGRQEYVEIGEGSLCETVRLFAGRHESRPIFGGFNAREIRFSKTSLRTACKDYSDSTIEDSCSEMPMDAESIPCLEELRFDILDEVEPDDLDPKTRAIQAAIKHLRDEYGVTPEDIEKFLDVPAKISRLVVDRNGSIELPDYDARLDLDTLSVAIYVLFLRHPEGIVYKCLVDYRDELIDIYSKIANRGTLREIVATVDHLVDPFNSGQISIHVSRIKKAFLNVKDERIAKLYYIKGPQGGAKSIELDRSMVSLAFH